MKERYMPNDKPFTCKECGVSFKTRNELDAHNKKAHSQKAGSPSGGKGSNY
jgi:uncharacterized C2H2 Zn-finger protein